MSNNKREKNKVKQESSELKYFNMCKCREERQVALFLYNSLLDNKCIDGENIREKCLLDEELLKEIESLGANSNDKKDSDLCVEIIDVYYEFAFMRDIFYDRKNKGEGKKFNETLLNFCSKKLGLNRVNPNVINDNNLGHCKLNLEDENNLVMFVARCMMNAKPDIAVWYKIGKNEYIRFLECKYHSSEDSYKIGNIKYKQTVIQNWIAEFIVEYLQSNSEKYMPSTINGNEKEVRISARPTRLISFNDNVRKEGVIKISANSLSELYKD